MKTFIVNLEQSVERKLYMENLLKDYPLEYEFIPAVDGRKIQDLEAVYDKNKAVKIAKRELNAGEIGCALSHKKIYKKMIDEHIPQALILEDDITILKNFMPVYTALSKQKIGNKIVLLDANKTKKMKAIWKKKIINNYAMYLVLNNYAGTYGYVIGLEAATRIYNHSIKILAVADDWKYYRRLCQIWLVSPSIVLAEEHFPTEIGNELRHER